jgi:hypothetical protein
LTSLICDLNRTFLPSGVANVASIKKVSSPLNLIGKQVRELRDRKGWTQEDLSAKLQVFGWDVSRRLPSWKHSNAVSLMGNFLFWQKFLERGRMNYFRPT